MSMTIDEKIRVLISFRDGHTIECASAGSEKWIPVKDPTWNFYTFNYRVKPEPREWDAWCQKDGTGLTDAWMERHSDNWRPVKVREVLP